MWQSGEKKPDFDRFRLSLGFGLNQDTILRRTKITMKPANNHDNAGHEPNPRKPTTCDHVNYRSKDGAVEVVTKVTTANRFPPHAYPIVCIRFRPQKGTRIQKLEDAEGLEVLLSHKEVIQHLMALNAADKKSRYTWLEVPEKPAERKAYWDKFNQDRRYGGDK